ncbi:MAG: fluoride efflux transporter CrcB [Bacteroidia bacterium]|nr:fluoride efflux transporter CrcB [Bacteroidia bacterium]
MPQFYPVLAVAIGGGIGAALRYLLSGAVYRVLGTDFPYGTLAVNLLGSVILGWLMEATEYGTSAAPMLRLFLGVGLCGGFTTFSTFSYETMRLLSDGVYLQALLNVAGSVGLCILGIWLGMLLARVI